MHRPPLGGSAQHAATASASESTPSTSRTAAPEEAAVLLVDDHDLFRAGLRQLLGGQHLRVVGDGRCESSVVELARRTRATVAVIDAQTADGSSTDELIAELTAAVPDIGVLIFTRSTDRLDIYRSIRAGARGYVEKGAPIEHLSTAIRTVQAGQAWIHPSLIGTVLEFIRSDSLPTTSRVDMSERELEVLRLVAEGLDNNEIAAALGISAKTVKNHVSSILAKLRLSNRVQASVYAIRSGIA